MNSDDICDTDKPKSLSMEAQIVENLYSPSLLACLLPCLIRVGLQLTPKPFNLSVLLVGSSDFNFLGFYMKYNKETKSLTLWRGSGVSQATLSLNRGGFRV